IGCCPRAATRSRTATARERASAASCRHQERSSEAAAAPSRSHRMWIRARPIPSPRSEAIRRARDQQSRLVVQPQRLRAQPARRRECPDAQQILRHMAPLRHREPPGTDHARASPQGKVKGVENIASTPGGTTCWTSPKNVTIRPLDIASDVELEQYQALAEALDEDTYGGHQKQSLTQLKAELEDSPYWTARRWVAIAETLEGGEMLVGRAAVFLPLKENLETISVG